MNKKELSIIKQVSGEVGIPADLGEDIITFFKRSVKERISTGEIVFVPNIGTFYPSKQKMMKFFYIPLVTKETIGQKREENKEYYKQFKKKDGE